MQTTTELARTRPWVALLGVLAGACRSGSDAADATRPPGRGLFWLILTFSVLTLSAASGGCSDDETSAAGDADTSSTDATDDSDSATGSDAGADGSELEETSEEPVVGDTYTNFAAGFLTDYCTSCHQSGGVASRVDLTGYDGVVAFADTIRCGTSPVQLDDCPDRGLPYSPRFPVGNGPRPGDDERQRLIDWIDAGLPE